MNLQPASSLTDVRQHPKLSLGIPGGLTVTEFAQSVALRGLNDRITPVEPTAGLIPVM